MNSMSLIIATLLNAECYAWTLIDTDCLSYRVIDKKFVAKNHLQRMKIKSQSIAGYDSSWSSYIKKVAVVWINIDEYCKKQTFFYIVSHIEGYDLLLELLWVKAEQVSISAEREWITIKQLGRKTPNQCTESNDKSGSLISATAYLTLIQRQQKQGKLQVFSASMADIQKALSLRKNTDPTTKLPTHYHKFLKVFDCTEADKLPPLRGERVDHSIMLKQMNRKNSNISWELLYKMSHEELLVLRKTLTELLNKQFIWVSNSPAAAPVLFVQKSGEELRFCVNYQGLNKIMRKDCYPLPLIQKTLCMIEKAKWFIKLNVIAAFHKIRIAEGDEWKTAFCTCYELYEWLVTPFELANALSTFQKYINWTLWEYLNEFCSVYMNDVLIYTDKSLLEHQHHICKILAKLQKADLQLDINKCEFEVKTTKYLEFIVEAEKEIQIDSIKVEAIIKWESSRSIKEVQSFLDFANFYWPFIKDFSEVIRSLTSLIQKDEKFAWNSETEEVFIHLKQMFVSAPILAQFDENLETILETDASNWCIEGALLQYQPDSLLCPCTFFSKKNLPAECNYEIYDKKMLVIVHCLKAWDTELHSVSKFSIQTDHKNLEYFMNVWKLTEWQMKWSLILSKYNFTIEYVTGKSNVWADALFCQKQDVWMNTQDKRLISRMAQLLKPEMLPYTKRPAIHVLALSQPVQVTPVMTEREPDSEDLEELWICTKQTDKTYQALVEALKNNLQRFPSDLEIRVSVNECSLSSQKELLFQSWHWVPESEKLYTELIQQTHDSVISDHSGWEITSSLLMCQFFWPDMLQEV